MNVVIHHKGFRAAQREGKPKDPIEAALAEQAALGWVCPFNRLVALFSRFGVCPGSSHEKPWLTPTA